MAALLDGKYMIPTYFDGVNRPSVREIKYAFLLLFLSFILIPHTARAADVNIPISYDSGTGHFATSTDTSSCVSGFSVQDNPITGFGNYGIGFVSPTFATDLNSQTYSWTAIAGQAIINGNPIYQFKLTCVTGTGSLYGDFNILDPASGTIVTNIPTGVTETTIISVDPRDGDTIATTSLPYELNTIGNVKDTDWKDGIRLSIKVDRNTDQQGIGALQAFDSAAGNYTYIPIPVEQGIFLLSTSTDSLNTTFPVNRVGTYTMTQSIEVPGLGVHWWIFNFDFNHNTLYSTTTTFTIGTSTAIDNITSQATNYLNNIASSTSQGDPLADCQFSWFSSAVDFSLGGKLMDCISGMVVWSLIPAPGVISTSFSQLRDGMLDRAPWGYATRMVDLFTGETGTSTATSTIPSWTAPIYLTGTSTPDTTLEFDPGDTLDGAATLLSSIKANGTNKNMRDIVEPYILLFIAICSIIIIFHDLMHMGHSKK